MTLLWFGALMTPLYRIGRQLFAFGDYATSLFRDREKLLRPRMPIAELLHFWPLLALLVWGADATLQTAAALPLPIAGTVGGFAALFLAPLVLTALADTLLFFLRHAFSMPFALTRARLLFATAICGGAYIVYLLAPILVPGLRPMRWPGFPAPGNLFGIGAILALPLAVLHGRTLIALFESGQLTSAIASVSAAVRGSKPDASALLATEKPTADALRAVAAHCYVHAGAALYAAVREPADLLRHRDKLRSPYGELVLQISDYAVARGVCDALGAPASLEPPLRELGESAERSLVRFRKQLIWDME